MESDSKVVGVKPPTVYGKGVFDMDYQVTKTEIVKGKRRQVWMCPYYMAWKNMIGRCYCEKITDRLTTYKDCRVCEDWLTFSTFKSWMGTKDWIGKQLDKDLLFEKSKVYSPQTCLWVDKSVNIFLVDHAAGRGQYAQGVVYHFSYHKGKRCLRRKPYQACCSGKYLGFYETELEAHRAWQLEKISKANKLVLEQTDERVIKGLQRVIEKIQSDYYSCMVTKSY